MRSLVLYLALPVLLIPTAAIHAAQEKLAPLPAEVLQARTVFVENRSGFVRARDEFASEVGKWDRFHIVYNRANANLVVVLTAQSARQSTQLSFVDPETGRTIWTNSAAWSDRGAVRDLLGDLKQRIAAQESGTGK